MRTLLSLSTCKGKQCLHLTECSYPAAQDSRGLGKGICSCMWVHTPSAWDMPQHRGIIQYACQAYPAWALPQHRGITQYASQAHLQRLKPCEAAGNGSGALALRCLHMAVGVHNWATLAAKTNKGSGTPLAEVMTSTTR